MWFSRPGEVGKIIKKTNECRILLVLVTAKVKPEQERRIMSWNITGIEIYIILRQS